MTTNDEARSAAVRNYIDKYRTWNRSRIENEEAQTEMVAAAREALDLGVSIREIKEARVAEDRAAERMTAFD